ncbi:MAG: hypothetical protein KJ710_08515 [Candidatus Omnitrophica bacterium]|nr:hypothetical protein [Candidatus Omnitrophota bacterium]
MAKSKKDKQDDFSFPKDELIKYVSYNAGLISKSAAETLRNLSQSDAYKQIDKRLRTFQSDIKAGWQEPECKSFGCIVGSFTKYTVEQLNEVCKATLRCLGKTCRKLDRTDTKDKEPTEGQG